jgi:hypothetical protein
MASSAGACLKEASSESLCGACQRVKSHQLSFSVSSSVSKAPLELIFSDVWGPVPMSVGKFKYYVSFIDNYRKFAWVYLLKNKSDVFQKFHDFQQLVERQFNTKILAIQTDLGVSIKNLLPFSNAWVLCIVSLAHTLTNKMALQKGNTVTLLKSVFHSLRMHPCH